MDRRTAIRTGALTAFGALFGCFKVVAAEPHGEIRVPLDQWRTLTFDYKGQRVTVPTSEVFAALADAYGTTRVTDK